MTETPNENDFDEVLDTGIRTCTSHLEPDDLLEVFRGRSGEAELNDLLRHALNRSVRERGWVAEREVTDGVEGLRRVDLAVTDTSRGWTRPARVAWIEAKLQYPANAFISPGMFTGLAGKSSAADEHRLAAAATSTPKYLLTWVPHLARSVRPIKYARGHIRRGDEWVSNPAYDQWREVGTRLLEGLGSTRVLTIREERGSSGDLTLDAWVTRIAIPRSD
ncbi:hypothetical protein [Ornithinimicrobium sp. W1665]|uniref:hypothetical protein n=1 Tax=Ornithinimicrobium sp. W1665 TaxID=3416666 RepID=UPI003CEF7E04